MDTPCVRNCCLNDEDICLGCGRSYQEILDWHQASEAQKHMILDNAKGRLLSINSWRRYSRHEPLK
ncbi:DUF1289 domain-containing protein [Shewanella sp.]|uniref:DUF1289 domain-containing protein n=1 Tax=Shewanella sp. TaxID=50422 RepID=UPI0035619AF8